jgi:hypothetical protein
VFALVWAALWQRLLFDGSGDALRLGFFASLRMTRGRRTGEPRTALRAASQKLRAKS